jgi:hypothetical protein
MRALRGDLFEITDEDPLALSVDDGEASESSAGGDVDPPSLEERPEPTGASKGRGFIARWLMSLAAVLACVAAAGLLALNPPEPQRQPGPGDAARRARPAVRAGGENPARLAARQRPERAAPRRRRAFAPREQADARPMAAASSVEAPPAPVEFAPAPSRGRQPVEREFGFER